MSSTNNDSEDDDPCRVHSSGMSSSGQPRRFELSKSELRKNNKPIMEKKRRARINQCLNELKSLILDALKKDPARHTKLEKADILEMTVRHLQSLHRSGGGGRPPAPTACPIIEPLSSPSSSSTAALTAVVVQKFQTGYQECAGEVNRFVDRLDGVDEDIKKRLMSHLDSCVAKMRHVAAAAGTAPPPPPPPCPHVNDNYSLLHRFDQSSAAAAALAAVASVPMPSGRPLLQSLLGDSTLPTSPTAPPPITPPTLPKVGCLRTSAFTAVHGPHTPPDVGGPSPFVYCDEPDVSSTSSWAEDVAAAAAAAVKNPPLDFSMKKMASTAGCSNKRPLGDIPVNVPNTAAASSSHKQPAATAAPGGDGSTPARVHRPNPGPDSDPNMWRPW